MAEPYQPSGEQPGGDDALHLASCRASRRGAGPCRAAARHQRPIPRLVSESDSPWFAEYAMLLGRGLPHGGLQVERVDTALRGEGRARRVQQRITKLAAVRKGYGR